MKKLLFALIITTLLVPVVLAMSSHSRTKEPLEKITFIHYKDGTVRGVGGTAKAPACYKLLGVKWKSLPVSYVISPQVDADAIVAATKEWNDHTSILFGEYSLDSSANFDDSPDGRNEYSYGNYPQSGVIAVTRIWYTRYSREIVEYDVMFDSDYIWGNADLNNDGMVDNPNVMDWQNIATHETGHGLGLSDVYGSSCSDVTMYGYSNYGEIKKRTLEQPDIIGLQKLYGS